MPIDTSFYSNIRAPEKIDLNEPMRNAMGLTQMAMQTQALQKQLGAKDYDQQAKALDFHINQAGAIANLAMGVKDQAGYDAALQQAQKMGMDTSTFPKQWDPDLTKAISYNSMKQADRLAAMKQQYELPNIQSNTVKNYAEAGKARADTAKTIAETPKPFTGQIDPSTNPAALITSYVPKDQQVKVAEEIKNAQDIKSLAPKIMAAFEKGSSRNPVIAAQGQREFEGLINTTVKDAEGTTRQAAFDSIHKTMTPSGLFAAPGENEARRRTVQEYLTSKSSAPIAFSHGIDLSKFDSTSPYREDNTQNGNVGSSAIPSANAGTLPKHGQVEDGYVFMGGDPSNPKSWKRAK